MPVAFCKAGDPVRIIARVEAGPRNLPNGKYPWEIRFFLLAPSVAFGDRRSAKQCNLELPQAVLDYRSNLPPKYKSHYQAVLAFVWRNRRVWNFPGCFAVSQIIQILRVK